MRVSEGNDRNIDITRDGKAAVQLVVNIYSQNKKEYINVLILEQSIRCRNQTSHPPEVISINLVYDLYFYDKIKYFIFVLMQEKSLVFYKIHTQSSVL